ncbi:hypothetical protein CEE36_01120 [candidate division TA06 bacterium B3_TA06]|uniref:CD-NTase-associated protein 12/Pycsar effector protein TIR domain-containing protein n=1 Tax=candidate division TA06 bacterium B3_TA06 TaxID=2012487 RepID=A0A532VAZ1_UNCT6|nr:MAG: hypothetical protein CEE36_01120 [candidate division TA06 bacterium B3_TA06]
MGIDLEDIIATLNGDLIALIRLEKNLRREESRTPMESYSIVQGASTKITDFKRDISQLLIENDLKEYADNFLKLPSPSDDFSARKARDIVVSYIAELEYIIKELSDSAEDLENKGEKKPRKRRGNKVFIVHGHDTPNLKRLKNLLKDKFGLDPIVLAERPGGVKPLIKKFEDEAKQVIFAFVLMTPDDLIGGRKYAQARPNVFFELGWFFGWFLCKTSDPDKRGVCILYQTRGKKVPPKINTDLDGVSRIEFEHSIENKETTDAIGRELRAAGLIK